MISCDNYENKLIESVFYLGSVLTDPLCKSHEYFRRIYTVESLHPEWNKCAQVALKVFFALGSIAFGVLGVIMAFPGAGLRAIADCLKKHQFVYGEGDNSPKLLSDSRNISLFSANVCGIVAGFPISDGGVMPIIFRQDRIIKKISKLAPDVICLSEVFDLQTARHFYSALKQKGYHSFYYHMGVKTVGLSSGLFIASRYEIQNPAFDEFTSSTGRASYSGKGVFSGKLASGGVQFAEIYATHLNHSEQVERPEVEEIQARALQMDQIKAMADVSSNLPQIITGDLNMDPAELESHLISKEFSSGDVSRCLKPTWGGDEWGAKNVAFKAVSEPRTLDYTLGRNVTDLITQFAYKIRFKADEFKEKALSDHRPLLSTFKV